METSHPYHITLQPTGARVEASAGTRLKHLLIEHGVEFPCGGAGKCRGCRVRVVEGTVPVDAVQRERLSPQEIDDGWRLACQFSVEDDITLDLCQSSELG